VICVWLSGRRLEKTVETTKILISSFFVVRRTTKIDEPSKLVGFTLCYEFCDMVQKKETLFIH